MKYTVEHAPVGAQDPLRCWRVDVTDNNGNWTTVQGGLTIEEANNLAKECKEDEDFM